MADADSTNNHLPVFEVELQNSEIVDLKLPDGTELGEGAYALSFSGQDWTGELNDGDLVFADPNLIPLADDYVVIWPKGGKSPAIEKMGMAFMPGSIGEDQHPDSNVMAVLSIARPNGIIKTVPCSRLEKVHKIIGKAHLDSEVHHD